MGLLFLGKHPLEHCQERTFILDDDRVITFDPVKVSTLEADEQRCGRGTAEEAYGMARIEAARAAATVGFLVEKSGSDTAELLSLSSIESSLRDHRVTCDVGEIRLPIEYGFDTKECDGPGFLDLSSKDGPQGLGSASG